MAHFRFVTLWEIAAPREAVWDVLVDYEQWPTWWPSVKEIMELEAGDPVTGIGQKSLFRWKTPLGYGFDFATSTLEVTPPLLLVARAEGQIIGEGRWELTTTEQGTEVVYFWTVETTQHWMDWMASVMRPLMEWNHAATMRQGGKGLAKFMNSPLLRNEDIDSKLRDRNTSLV